MDIAKELDEMGRRAGGDGRAILTIEACTRGDADSYAEGENPVKTHRATRASVFVSLARGRSVSVELTRREGEVVIAEVLGMAWDRVRSERNDEELDALRCRLGEICRLSQCPA